MTIALALVFLGLLLIYCGLKGKSLSSALVGRAFDAPSGGLLQKAGR